MCLLFACNSSPAVVDASFDADTHADVIDPDACATCQSLTAFCASGASTPPSPLPCPPALDSPDFDAWARDRFAKQFAPLVPSCSTPQNCPETIMVSVNDGVDCWLEYIFDSSTKKLVAIAEGCNGHVGCIASEGCLPLRCMNDGGETLLTSSSCPPMPDSGPVDAGAE